MKLLASLILMIAMAFNGPSFCAHALNADTTDMSTAQEMPGHDMNHHMQEHDDQMTVDHGGHCPDDCDGGNDCQGCSAVAAAIVANAESPASATPTPVRTLRITGFLQTLFALDPPPPKTLF